MKIPVSTSSSKIMNTRRNMPEKMDVEVTTHDGPCVSSSISSGYKRPRRHTHPLHPTSLLLSPRNKQTALNVPSSSSFKKLKVPSTLFPHPSSASPFNGHLNLPSLDSTIPFGNSTSMLSSSLLPISMSPSSLWSTVPTSSRSPPLPTTTLSDPNPPEWCVILKNDMQQVVLYNPSNHALIVVPDRFQFQPSSSRLSPNPSSSTAPSTSLSLSQETRLVQLPCHFCPLCQQPYSITLPPTSNVTPSVPMSSSTNTTVSTTPAESAVASSFSGDHPITTSPRVKDPSLLPSCSDMPFMDELNSPNNTYQTRMGRSTTENYKVNDLEPEMESGSNQLVHTSSFMHRHYFRLLANVHENQTSWNSESNPDWQTPLPSTSTQSLRRCVSLSETEEPSSSSTFQSEPVHTASFNEGYYDRFFIEIKKLGRGARGSVYLCRHVLDNIPIGEYAIKKVAVGDNHPWLSRILREVTLLECLRHPNIVHYKHAWLESHQHSLFGPKVPFLFILMECAKGGNLEEYLHPELPLLSSALIKQKKWKQSYPRLPEAYYYTGIVMNEMSFLVRLLDTYQIMEMLKGIAKGLAHLHFHGIVHKDLKPSNLLLSFPNPTGAFSTAFPDEIPTVMISDFGECEKLSNDTLDSRTGATGTLDFTAPELLENKEGIYIHRYSVKADIWSFGLLAYFVCFGSLPFTQIDDVDLLKTEISTFSIHQWQYPYRPQVPERLIKLIQACLSRIPSERPSSKTVVNWIMDIQTEVAGETMNSFTSTTSIPRSTNDAKSPPSATIPSTATTTTNAHNTTTRSTVVSAPQFLQLPPPTPLTSSFKDLIQTDSWLLGLTISIKLACMFQASFIVFLFCFLSVLGDIIFKWHRLGYWNPLLHLLLVSLIYILETQGTRP